MSLEEQRLVLQTELDGQRSSEERNKEGQFATPTELARVVADYAVSLSPSEQVLRVLEPSCGSGAFINAILNALTNRPKAITGVEMDPRFALAARSLWQGQAEIVEDDFLEWIEEGDTLFDLIVANPPYVRHHHMSTDVKAKRNAQATKHTGISISKLAGLYVYFILASQRRLAPGAVATWLIPSEFMTVNYGSALRKFLSLSVTTVRVHTFDASEAQFDDALVTSCVVTYKNEVPNAGHEVLFTTGSQYASPKSEQRIGIDTLIAEEKWPRLFDGVEVQKVSRYKIGDLFQARRGIATGNNNFFIRERADFAGHGVGEKFLTPVLPGPRDLPQGTVEIAPDGWPDLPNQLALIDCPVSLEVLQAEDPGLFRLMTGAPSDVLEGYLVKARKPWYRQEQRAGAPIVCTYMGRSTDGKAPFRFVRNRSSATFTNAYLGLFMTDVFRNSVTDVDAALDVVWTVLSKMNAATLMYAGREYGGGLQKLEPKELASLPADEVIRELEAANLWTATPSLMDEATLFSHQ